MAAVTLPTPSASIMNPSCETVEYARIRFDVGLRDGDQRREKSGESPDPGDGGQRDRDMRHRVGGGENRKHAGDEKDAGRHHRGRVDECADRGRALHRVRQPDMERELAGFPRRAAEDEECDTIRDSEPDAGGFRAIAVSAACSRQPCPWS